MKQALQSRCCYRNSSDPLKDIAFFIYFYHNMIIVMFKSAVPTTQHNLISIVCMTKVFKHVFLSAYGLNFPDKITTLMQLRI